MTDPRGLLLLALAACGTPPPAPCTTSDLAACDAACAAGDGPACTTAATALFPPGRSFATVIDTAMLSRVIVKGCDLGEAYACGVRGAASHTGSIGYERDEASAIQYFTKACDGGLGTGCLYAGYGNSDGWTGQRDTVKATAAFASACTHGEMTGCSEQGWLVQVAKPEEAVALWQKGCDANNGESCRGLAWAQVNGNGTARDEARGLATAKKGCATGQSWTCGYYGWMLHHGVGTPADVATAAPLLQRACRDGYQYACDNPAPVKPPP